jgi:hypothetical protein
MAKTYTAADFDTWPRDNRSGQLICSLSHPMPKGAEKLGWIHLKVSKSHGEHTDYITCEACKYNWTEEIAR